MENGSYNNTYNTRRIGRDAFSEETPERLNFAFSSLEYNQGLIQFADTKANTLLLINSIFIATATTLMATPQEGSTLGTIFSVVRIVFLLLSVTSVINCLMVVSPVKENYNKKRKDFVFYMDILAHNTPDNCYFEFTKTKTVILLEDLIKRGY